jgi:Zn-finger nucleic acid-binding protein
MQCPKCHAELTRLKKSGFSIENCATCWGFWLDRGELEQMVTRLAGQREDTRRMLDGLQMEPDPPEASARDCPRCHQKLGTVRFVREEMTITTDKCPGCGGVWLDSGEMGLLHVAMQMERGKYGLLKLLVLLVAMGLLGLVVALLLRAFA